MKGVNQSSNLQTHDDENMNMSAMTMSRHGISRNNTASSNKKRLNMSKKIENVEYLIKIEQKNKRQLEEKYTKQIFRLENQIEKLEKELETNLKELNEKESKIFDIQKKKLDTFKYEIKKYENVYKEMEDKSIAVYSQIEDSYYDEQLYYNQSNMCLEDYFSYNNEITYQKSRVVDLRENLKEIENTYPKEFEFLLEDIALEKDMNELSANKKLIQQDIDALESNKKVSLKAKELKMHDVQMLIEEIKKIQVAIDTFKKDSHISKLEDHISKNVSDLLVFEKLKILIQKYYSQKNFDLENELNVILIKNLNDKMKEMKNEFVSIKNEKLLSKSKLEKIIDELTKIANNNKNSVDKLRVDKDINYRMVELDKLNNEISILELNCKKKETLFNKYIIVLRNKCKKSSQESYFEMNPAIIIENEFEDKFKEEIHKLIDQNQNISNEEKIKHKNIIEIFFKEMINREKVLQANMLKKKKNEELIEHILKEIGILDENINLCDVEISNKKFQINEINTKDKVFIEKIQSRNRNLTFNLEQMGESEFEKYLKSNDNVLKNMKKVYGNKILDKVFKVQKQKFLENVIMDHSYKKGKVNEFITLITQVESTIENYDNSLSELEKSYKFLVRKYEGVLDFKDNKFKEKKLLDESQLDLKDKMESILQSQISEIEMEKRQLQFKFNINYYIEKIKEISEKISELSANKENMLKEYEHFSNIINEKEQKLYHEDLDMKNNLISLRDEQSSTVMPYKVNKSIESGRKNDYIEQDLGESDRKMEDDEETENINFDEIIKKSIAEYNSRDESAYQDEEIIKSEEDLYKRTTTNGNISPGSEIKDPFIGITIEKIKPLVHGITLFKRFNNNSMNGKVFDPFQPDCHPESCGYAGRLFKFNTYDEILEIKNSKSKHIELKISLKTLKGIMLGSSAKTLIKQKKNSVSKPNQEINKLINVEYIPFILLYQDGNMELIAPNYQTYKTLEGAVEEIVKNRKNLNSVFKYIDI